MPPQRLRYIFPRQGGMDISFSKSRCVTAEQAANFPSCSPYIMLFHREARWAGASSIRVPAQERERASYSMAWQCQENAIMPQRGTEKCPRSGSDHHTTDIYTPKGCAVHLVRGEPICTSQKGSCPEQQINGAASGKYTQSLLNLWVARPRTRPPEQPSLAELETWHGP
ncbi:hypothetical protein LCI18_014485 [Fusarium solani-melongenae]|uniref:Uncharacterized protein n=1 Tax=Fusarium solani subsp. cucurbitae TaxID=2747967 RepID=A0ACD3ZQQ2_FUSSC|nr:hypothetical protein LCI18_014485 [Fusarium solani-melongenae]